MLNLNCYVGAIRPFTRIPFPLMLNNRSIEEYFAFGSMDGEGNPGISLSVDQQSRINSSILPPDRPTNAFYLQNSLSRLTQNNPADWRIRNIGLLIADELHERSTVMGIMFDQGFNPQGLTPVSDIYLAVPREGCAIFLNPIRGMRNGDEQFRDEVVFTAIHELGHVFNLWHIPAPLSFMSQSDANNTYPPSAYGFRPEQRELLHFAETDRFTRPGGSNFMDRGSRHPAENNPIKQRNIETHLNLQIEARQKEFWYFEPVELDIKLSLTLPNYPSVVVQDKLDPGYEDFLIYITRPDGTKFRYRSPKYYCSNSSELTITQQSPFLRDISIFGQAGGYTFRSPGIYMIQCFFNPDGKGFIVSNELEINIKKLDKKSAFENLHKFMTSMDAGLFVYHRSGYFTKAFLNELEDRIAKQRKTDLSSNLSYAISRYLSHRTVEPDKSEKGSMKKYIDIALSGGLLSENKQNNLQKVKHRFNL